MKQLVIQELSGKAFWFDGEKLESVGNFLFLRERCGGGHPIVAIGDNIYYRDKDNCKLLMGDAVYCYSADKRYSQQAQFRLDNGVLLFRESEDSKDIRLPTVYAEKFPELLSQELEHQEAFMLISQEKAIAYYYDADDIPQQLDTINCASRNDGVLWNGRFFRRDGSYLRETSCRLVYQGRHYLIFALKDLTFALFDDGRAKFFSAFLGIKESRLADFLETGEAFYHLRDDDIRKVGHFSVANVDDKGTIRHSYTTSMGADFPETTEEICEEYTMINGCYHYKD